MVRGTYRGGRSNGQGRRGVASVYHPRIEFTARTSKVVFIKESPSKSPKKKSKLMTDIDTAGQTENLYNNDGPIDPLLLKIGKVM